jgi:putative protease
MAFSRGLHTGWFGGTNNQALVHARFGKKRGVYLGAVQRVERDRVYLRLEAPLKPGDGIVFDAGHPDEAEQGGRVYGVEKTLKIGGTAISFGHDDVDLNRVHVGDKIWKTSDPQLDRKLRQSFAGDAPHFRRPLDVEAHGRAGQTMTLIGRDEIGHVVQLDSAMPLATAQKQPLTTERLREQVGRLGGTPFVLRSLKNALEGEVILPMSELNRLRRAMADELEALRAQPKRWILNESNPSFITTAHPDIAMGGVRPSPAAASTETLGPPLNSRAGRIVHVAAPGDGRTP